MTTKDFIKFKADFLKEILLILNIAMVVGSFCFVAASIGYLYYWHLLRFTDFGKGREIITDLNIPYQPLRR